MSSKLTCSRSHTGGKPSHEQRYVCKTCNNMMVCEVCLHHCHRQHSVMDAGTAKDFVCQCGSRGSPFCGSLVPHLPESQSLDTCSFVVTNRRTAHQHYFHCDTCGIKGSMGVCELCAKVCHAGHSVSHAGFSPYFYCDCGAGGAGQKAAPCQCTRPRVSATRGGLEAAIAQHRSGSALSAIEAEMERLDWEVCSIVTHGRTYTAQHYFHCLDCALVGNLGCCETCARHCHRGHRVAYAGMSPQFFCDCGDSGRCRAIQPVQVVPSHMLEALAQAQKGRMDQLQSEKREAHRKAAAEEAVDSEGVGNGNSDDEHDDDDRFMCKVCMERKIDTVILECGHQALCSSCMQAHKWESCPICSKAVARIVKTYLA